MNVKKIILTAFVSTMFNGMLAVAASKPNIVIFLVDDLRDELACYGSDHIKSPNIDKLAEQGVQFNKAYCQQAICAPSRMSILTGLRVETLGIYGLFTKLRDVHPDVVTMPQLFKQNGYKTISIGKVYHSGLDDRKSFTTFIAKELNSYVIPGNDTLKPAFEAGDVNDTLYKDGRVANHAISILNEVKSDNFLMIVGLSKPHLPYNAPKKYWDLYDKNKILVPSRNRPENMYKEALTTSGELRAYGGIPAEGDLDDDLTKNLIHGYYACVSYIDAQIGKVMQKLNDLDLRKNTIVVLMSDHGYKIGEYGSWCKHSNMEMDVHVPLIVSRETSYANRVTNAKSEALVENIDVFPTLIEACGLVSPQMDGKSLVPLLENPDMAWDEAAYGLYPRGRSKMGVTVTDGIWRYTEWRDSKTQEVFGTELYWHKNSDVVNANLSGFSNYSNVESKMKSLLELHFPLNYGSFHKVSPINNAVDKRQ